MGRGVGKIWIVGVLGEGIMMGWGLAFFVGYNGRCDTYGLVGFFCMSTMKGWMMFEERKGRVG